MYFFKIINRDAPSWKVYENEKVYAFLDIIPVRRYHTLVIPKKHYENIFDIADEDLKAVISVVGKLAKLYQKKLGINHVQVVNSNGKEAQQDVFHIHYHIIPRKLGDGQSIRWKTFTEWRPEFDGMLEKLRD